MEYVGETGTINRSIFRVSEEMEALRHTNPNGKMGGPSPTALAPTHTQQGQGLLAILVMVSVLVVILAYCCWDAPCCKFVCCRHPSGEAAETEARAQVDVTQCVSTPTIILLPYGRMLVVDGAVFAQFQADTTGLDLLELGESVIRAQQGQLPTPSLASTGSILEIDSEVFSKDHSASPVTSLPPPTYESLFGDDTRSWRLPPSYSDTLVVDMEALEGANDTAQVQESRV